MSSNEILELLNQIDENSTDMLDVDAKNLIQFYHQRSQKIEKMETETKKIKSEVKEIKSLHPNIDINSCVPDFTQMYEMHHEKEDQEQKIQNIQSYCDELKMTIQEREIDLKKMQENQQKILADISEKESTNKNLKQSLENANASYNEANQRLDLHKKDFENNDSKISQLRNDIEERKRTIKSEQTNLKLSSSYSRKKSIDLKKFDHPNIIGMEFSSLLDDSYDPDAIFITGTGRFLSKWKFSTAKEIKKCDLFSEPIAFHIEPESSLISISCVDDYTYIYDPLTLQLMSTLNSHQRSISDNCWITRNQILTASRERTIQLYDIDQSRLHRTILVENPIKTICSLGNMYYFMITDESGCISIVDIRDKGNVVNSIDNFGESRRVIINTLLPNSLYEKVYALEYRSNYIYEIDISTMKIINRLSHSSISKDNKFSCMTIDPFSNFLAAGTTNGSIVIFDISNNITSTADDDDDDDDDNEINVLKKKHDKSVTCAKFGPNKLLTSDYHNLIFWE